MHHFVTITKAASLQLTVHAWTRLVFEGEGGGEEQAR